MRKVAIIGASGFVGTNLVKRLARQNTILALTRTCPLELPPGVQWRPLNLFSAQSTFEALDGVDIAIYLVHSMMPSSRLFQGDFHDTDLLLADNFARGCVANGIKRIIYLSGVMPKGYISPHLQSRFEVEEIMSATAIPVTVLRAGMIVGPGGSSYEILKTLVQRLPFMILPEWTKRSTQAVFIDDVIEVIAAAIEDRAFEGQTLDVVNGEPLKYKSLLKTMAKVLGLKRPMIPVPIRSTEFSKLWVQIFGNSTRELVSPLIDSLLCDLPQVVPSPLIDPIIRYRTFEEMARASLLRDRGKMLKRPARKVLYDKSVRSIQRLPSVTDHDCKWIAEQFMKWLPGFLPYLIQVVTSKADDRIEFNLLFFNKPLLVLKNIQGKIEGDRIKFHIVGGCLTNRTDTGWLEFRQTCNRKYTLAAIHEFVPSLPWQIYLLSQAPMHKYAMFCFARHLFKITATQSQCR